MPRHKRLSPEDHALLDWTNYWLETGFERGNVYPARWWALQMRLRNIQGVPTRFVEPTPRELELRQAISSSVLQP